MVRITLSILYSPVNRLVLLHPLHPEFRPQNRNQADRVSLSVRPYRLLQEIQCTQLIRWLQTTQANQRLLCYQLHQSIQSIQFLQTTRCLQTNLSSQPIQLRQCFPRP